MSKSSKAETVAETEAAVPAEQVVVDMLASILRVVAKLSDLPAFGACGISMQEWLFLSHIKASDEVARSGAVGIKLGMSPQRANQIVDALSEKSLVDVKASSEDARKKDLGVTKKGNEILARINKEVTATAASVPSIRRASQILKLYSRALAVGMRVAKS